jgi:hypothetical protein
MPVVSYVMSYRHPLRRREKREMIEHREKRERERESGE